VTVGLRLGLNLCVLHQCHCKAPVDASGLHSFVCKQAPSKTARHHALNDVVARAFDAAGIPVSKEPAGLRCTNGMTLIPWQAGKSAVCDVTVVCTSAVSYLNSSAHEAGAAAEFAASRKTAKYVSLAAGSLIFPDCC